MTGPDSDPPTDPSEDGGPTSADGPLRGFTGYLMKRAFNLIQADLARALEPFGLRMVPFSALLVIVDNPGLSQTELAAALAIERSNMVTVLDGLAAQGLVRRDAVENNRRAHALHATPAGERLAADARRAVTEHERRLFGGLSAGEHGALRGALAKLLDAGR